MKTEDMIREGSIVRVEWESIADIEKAEVIATPLNEGEAWVLKQHTGEIVYVQHFSKMTRLVP